MGNRAVITTVDGANHVEHYLGVYLHWNGGRDSVEAFLTYCKFKGYRPPEQDNYGWARLCQVIGNFFGGSTSIGIDEVSRLDCDNYDNGLYVIENWEIVGRKYFTGMEQNEYDLEEMLNGIDSRQPAHEQLGKENIHELLEEVKMTKTRRIMTLDEIREELAPEWATEEDGICALVDVENMGWCKDGVTRWYTFADDEGNDCIYFKH